MAEPTTKQTAGPLQLLESGAAGYCDPVTGLCMLPASQLPELRNAPDTTTDPAEKVDPIADRPQPSS